VKCFEFRGLAFGRPAAVGLNALSRQPARENLRDDRACHGCMMRKTPESRQQKTLPKQGLVPEEDST
jgi:hypothetical protein